MKAVGAAAVGMMLQNCWPPNIQNPMLQSRTCRSSARVAEPRMWDVCPLAAASASIIGTISARRSNASR